MPPALKVPRFDELIREIDPQLSLHYGTERRTQRTHAAGQGGFVTYSRPISWTTPTARPESRGGAPASTTRRPTHSGRTTNSPGQQPGRPAPAVLNVRCCLSSPSRPVSDGPCSSARRTSPSRPALQPSAPAALRSHVLQVSRSLRHLSRRTQAQRVGSETPLDQGPRRSHAAHISAGCGDAGHAFAGSEPQVGQGLAAVPGVEGFDVEGEVFAGVAAAQRLAGVFAGQVEHHAAKQ